MKIKEYAKTKFDLKNESIDEFSDWLTESLGAIKTEKCTILKIRILLAFLEKVLYLGSIKNNKRGTLSVAFMLGWIIVHISVMYHL